MPAGVVNPCYGIPTRETATIFRQPFSPGDLELVVNAASADDFIRPIIITGICTAMRRGDCCQLKWRDVDLRKGFITVKTGQTVSIPIFPMLHDEISRWSTLTAACSSRTGLPHAVDSRLQLLQFTHDTVPIGRVAEDHGCHGLIIPAQRIQPVCLRQQAQRAGSSGFIVRP